MELFVLDRSVGTPLPWTGADGSCTLLPTPCLQVRAFGLLLHDLTERLVSWHGFVMIALLCMNNNSMAQRS